MAPDVAAFCEAELATEAAVASEDPALIGPALEALVVAAPEDIRATVEEVIALADAGPTDPAFEDAYGALIEYVAANCGFAELDATATEYAFGGVPEEVAAGPTIISLTNIGEQVHEIVIYRINDDVTLTVEELLAVPEEASESMLTEVGGTFAVPGGTGHTVVDLTPGRHVALCFIPDGTTLEVFEQMVAEEMPDEGSARAEDSAPAEDSAAAEGSAPAAGSAPAEGSVPARVRPPPTVRFLAAERAHHISLWE